MPSRRARLPSPGSPGRTTGALFLLALCCRCGEPGPSAGEAAGPAAAVPLWFLADHGADAEVRSPLADAWARRPAPRELALADLDAQEAGGDGRLYFLPEPVARDAEGVARLLEVRDADGAPATDWRDLPARQEVRFAELPSAAGHPRPRTPDGQRGVRFERGADAPFEVWRLGGAARLDLRCAVRRDADPAQAPTLTLLLEGEVIRSAKAMDWASGVVLPPATGRQTLTLRVGPEARDCPVTVATATVQHDGTRDALWCPEPLEGGTLRYRAADPPARLPLHRGNQPAVPQVTGTVPLVAGTCAVLAPGGAAIQVLLDGVPVASGKGEVAFPVAADGPRSLEVRGSEGPLRGDLWLVQPDALLRHPEGTALERDPSGPGWIGRVTLEGDTRRSLLLVAGTTLRVPLPVATSPRTLSFATGVTSLEETLPAAAAPLRVSVEADGPEPQVLWQGRAAPGPWQPVEVALPPTARTLVLEVPSGPALSRLQLLALGGCRIQDASAARPSNVLIYLVDTLRADALSCLGGARPTPHMDAFAEDAILFERAQAPAPWTRPSVASLFTGLHYSFHGAGKESGLADELFTLAEHLHDRGRDTAAFVANAQIHATGLRFAQGFERMQAIDQVLGESDAEHVLARALPWLEEARGRPFFLYLHTIDPHMPYEAPEAVRGLYQGDYSGPLLDRRVVDALMLREMPDLADADVRFLRDRYDEEVFYSDQQFGLLVQRLKDLGLYEDTTIVLVSDHGEEFAEHGDFGHGGRLWEELLHVPLLIKPAGADHPRGLRVDTPVSLVDVFPTVAALAGAPLLPGRCQGTDRSDLWSAPVSDEAEPVLAEEEPGLRSILLGGWKLIEEDGEPGRLHLYRLEGRGEQDDLAVAEPDRREALSGRLHGRLQAFREAGFAPPKEVLPLRLDPDELEALRRLGYVDR